MGAGISIALTIHSETIVTGPTIRSMQTAIDRATTAGIAAEILLGLDNPPPETAGYFESLNLPARIIRMSNADLGLSRNELAREARFEWLAFLDADDLFSENWLLNAFRQHIRSSRRLDMIVHPELNLFFDGQNSMIANREHAKPVYDPTYYHFRNYYDSLVITSKTLLQQIPYRARDKRHRLGYEDWIWNLDTLEVGAKHVIARDTIIFKRRRETSLLSDLAQNKSLRFSSPFLTIPR